MSSNSYENRTYVRWDEVADLVGVDGEGLRQGLLYGFRGHGDATGELWLPVVLESRGEGFLTSYQFDSWSKEPAFQWTDRGSYHANCEGRSHLNFADGSQLLLRGNAGADSWEAVPNYGSGLPFTFAVVGQTLVIRPEGVRHACAHEGYFDSVDIAPRDWCENGFPEEFFHVVERPGSMFEKKPTNLFEEGRFLVEDVVRLRAMLSGRPGPTEMRRPGASKDKSLRSDTRQNLVRIIRVLREKAGWPEREAVGEILQLLQSHGFDGPGDDTVRKVLAEARALEPDFPPK